MNRYVRYGAYGLAGLGGVVFLFWLVNRCFPGPGKGAGWNASDQPPETVTDLGVLTAEQSWAANRCRPMIGSCTGYTAGTRVRRTYPGTLSDPDCAPGIRASFNFGLGG